MNSKLWVQKKRHLFSLEPYTCTIPLKTWASSSPEFFKCENKSELLFGNFNTKGIWSWRQQSFYTHTHTHTHTPTHTHTHTHTPNWGCTRRYLFCKRKQDQLPSASQENMFNNFAFHPTCPYPFLLHWSGSSGYCRPRFLTPRVWSLPWRPGTWFACLALKLACSLIQKMKHPAACTHALEKAWRGDRGSEMLVKPVRMDVQ